MIAKLVAHAPSRSEAFATLADALAALALGPLVHNGPLLQRLCEVPEVLAMRHHTQWPIPTDTLPVPAIAWPLATLWLATCERDASPWQQAAGFRLGPTRRFCATVRIGEETRTLTLTERGGALLWQSEQIPFELGSDQIRLCQGGHWQRYPVQPLGEGHGQRGLAYTALLIGYGDDLGHCFTFSLSLARVIISYHRGISTGKYVFHVKQFPGEEGCFT